MNNSRLSVPFYPLPHLSPKKLREILDLQEFQIDPELQKLSHCRQVLNQLFLNNNNVFTLRQFNTSSLKKISYLRDHRCCLRGEIIKIITNSHAIHIVHFLLIHNYISQCIICKSYIPFECVKIHCHKRRNICTCIVMPQEA